MALAYTTGKAAKMPFYLCPLRYPKTSGGTLEINPLIIFLLYTFKMDIEPVTVNLYFWLLLRPPAPQNSEYKSLLKQIHIRTDAHT